ncbi:MAG: S1C family serine protease, partial [Vicinamibacterales bacterium]
IAVLRLPGVALPTAERDGNVLVGSIVLAIGRAGELSATTGVVSAVGGPWQAGQGRRIERLIATDAPMFPGFSGGPLIDASGHVIGLLSSHLGRGQTLAVPAADVDSIVSSLTQGGRVPRGFLGVAAQSVELPAVSGQSRRRGLLLIGVDDGGPAAEAGLTVGDIVLEVNGASVTSMDDLRPILGPGSAGQQIRAGILRGGSPRDLTIVIGERAA